MNSNDLKVFNYLLQIEFLHSNNNLPTEQFESEYHNI